jgi:NADH-quinone oxidoreductase subunit C
MTDQPEASKPEDKKPEEKKPEAAKPAAGATPAAGGAAAKPAAAAGAAPAAAGAHAAAAKPAEPPKELPIGPFGQFLKDLGIASTRLPDNFGSAGMCECLEVDGKDLENAMKRLRGTEMQMTMLCMVSGVESPDTWDSVYHLWSYEDPTKELVVKVRVPKASVAADQLPVVPSLTPFWPAANWHEREEYDLFGIKYFGHPYLRRLMNPWDWEGWPLRKDYKQPIDALNDKNPHSMR